MDRRLRSRWIVILFVAAFFVPYAAQAQERLFAGGLGAVTFGTASTGSDWAARAGVNASRHVAFFGEFGGMTDVLPTPELQTMSDTASSIVANGGGTTSAVLGKVPASYGLFGLQANGREKNHVTPFGDVSYGWAH